MHNPNCTIVEAHSDGDCRPLTITESSTDGRTVRVEFGPYSFSPAEALAFSFDLTRAAAYAENADSRHERHINLLASCPLCVYEAESQPDRLTDDDEPDSRYYWQPLDDANVGDLTASAHGGELLGIVDEIDGGIIGYALGEEHANKMIAALETYDGR